MNKTYLFTVLEDDFYDSLKEEDVIVFEMPPFCSGDYEAKICKDKHGLYINKDDDYFKGCRDFSIRKKK